MKILRIVVCTLALCVFTAPAFATPITSTFTVTATEGPLVGQTSTGHFTFDSSSIVFGTFTVDPSALTSLVFGWHGVTYTTANANLGFLWFDADGTLISMRICTEFPDCSVSSLAEQWYAQINTVFHSSIFTYAVPGVNGVFNGTMTLDTPLGPRAPIAAAVPEPTSLLLLGTGVASALAARRRKQSA